MTALYLESVWSAFERVANELPGDAGVMMTLQYYGWYSDQCPKLSHLLE
jgi:hypothetical protein